MFRLADEVVVYEKEAAVRPPWATELPEARAAMELPEAQAARGTRETRP
jgi:hypothetical protein